MYSLPDAWKSQKLVLITKEKGDPSGYRSLSMLDVVGKLQEKFIIYRLTEQNREDSLTINFGGEAPHLDLYKMWYKVVRW